MGKRIVFCADGTWQEPMRGTNVYRLYKALTVTADQVTYYDDGVGADATGLGPVLDGSFGAGWWLRWWMGIRRSRMCMRRGMRFICSGSAGGAYTVRSLAGMIAGCGLPLGTFTDGCVAAVFAAYRDPVNRAALLGKVGCGLEDAVIRMIGVWDTVGSLGIPAIFGGVDAKKYGFLDTGLHPDVKNAFQCLAVDEKRAQFPATLWTSAPAPGQVIEQVWFSGCHGDVGGGTSMSGGVDAGTRLCDIPLGWMAGKALGLGLTMDAAVAASFAALPARYALDHMRESWSAKCGPQHLRPVDATAWVANSVGVRVQYGLTYLPGNLKVREGALAGEYELVEVVDEAAV